MFKDTYFEDQLRMAASNDPSGLDRSSKCVLS